MTYTVHHTITLERDGEQRVYQLVERTDGFEPRWSIKFGWGDDYPEQYVTISQHETWKETLEELDEIAIKFGDAGWEEVAVPKRIDMVQVELFIDGVTHQRAIYRRPLGNTRIEFLHNDDPPLESSHSFEDCVRSHLDGGWMITDTLSREALACASPDDTEDGPIDQVLTDNPNWGRFG